MVVYRAPLADIRFLLHEVHDYRGGVGALPGFEEANAELLDAVLEEAARFCENELLPLNQPGDKQGCTFENGVVRTPDGFQAAYRAFAEGGWTGLACDPAHGGQGLPETLQLLVNELVCSANLSFGIYPGLSHGAYHLLAQCADEDQKAAFLPRLADGSWSGTMCLTEPHCGTDLGLVRTRAEPGENGAYRITGTKIFISAGEHDLTENIVHLVLARLPDAPPGTKGISLFIVPKFLPRPEGGPEDGPGPRNGVSCGGLEDKMGIKASATCVLNFDAAEGTLVGRPHSGMRAMFTMMNMARLDVGLQGLGLAETAYQSAAAYARERLQGRALSGAKRPDKPADPIIVHPDVRNNLMTMRALTEGGRALAVWVAMAADIAERHEDPARRQEADDLVALMTPVLKAHLTDIGFEVTNLGVQVFGGHGYIRDNGMEQLVRDARIAQIYEGANGIQALDLVGRKLGQHSGRLLRRFFHPARDFLEARRVAPRMAEFVVPTAKAFSRLQRASLWVAQKGLADPEEAGAAAGDYLRLFGLTAQAYLWTRMAEAAMPGAAAAADGFHAAKLATARYFMGRVLPRSSAAFAALMAGKASVMALDETDF